MHSHAERGNDRKNLLKARVEQAKARYDYIRAVVALRLWGGKLSPQDIADINAWFGAP